MKQQLNSLQLYRGLASILVVLTHANIIFDRELAQRDLFKIFDFGWVGVDFFFVLSGFIIFYIHRSDIGHPDRFKSFITKRFLRVYPLYWIVLFSKIIGSLVGDRNGVIYQINLYQLFQAISLIPQSRANSEIFIGVSWTLTYEIFFYLMFGLMILIKPKIFQPIIIMWIVGILLNFVNLISIKESLLLNFIFNERNLEFIFGCVAGHIVLKSESKHGLIMICTALGMLILSVVNTRYHEFDVSGVSPAIAYGIPFTILIIGSVLLEKSVPLKIPSILVYLGNASYSIYLTHGFFINNITRIYLKLMGNLNKNFLLSPANIIHTLVAIMITIIGVAIGCGIHTWVEKPLMKMLRRK